MSKYEKGTKCKCKWKGDEKWRTAEIVDTRPLGASPSVARLRKPQLEYYIHFAEFDRRLDEWVTVERLGEIIVVDHAAIKQAQSRKHRKR
jgi:hypothetical protein